MYALHGCGTPSSTDTAPTDATGSNDAAGAGGVSLSVTSSTQMTTIGSTPAHSGNVFLVASLTLTNDSVASPIPANLTLFTLSTDASLVYAASARSVQLSSPCPTTTMIATGGMISCRLAFEIPASETAITLAYDDHAMHTANAAVPAPTIEQGVSNCQFACGAQMPMTINCARCVQSQTICQAEQQALESAFMADDNRYNAFITCKINHGVCSSTSTDSWLNSCQSYWGACDPNLEALEDAYWGCLAANCASMCQ
jgi:hypothetical protein